MKRVFLLPLILLILPSVLGKKLKLLNTVFGEVGAGNYTYYSLMYEGPITLHLITERGDADLYVSQLTNRPTFEHESFCLQSATCGLDIVHIPESFTRPIGIGIYGHPSHEISNFILEVYLRNKFNEISSIIEEYSEFTEEDQQYIINENERSVDENSEWSKSNDDPDIEEPESFLWTLILSFLEIFFEVFFL